MRWPSPAKINLFLHVLGRRADGYHELQTLFQLLEWGDELDIEPTDDPGIHRTHANYDVPESGDLAIRAARLLQQESGSVAGALIGVYKQIPAGAGLGGGSSNAATVLRVLNQLWGCGLSVDDLAALGARLGADVPVFVKGFSAMATGVGERLEPITLGERHYLLVFPGIHISTAEVFGDPGLKRNSAPISTEMALRGEGRNDCEAVVITRYPQMNRIMQSLADYGKPVMTGTGSAIFLAMNDEKCARRGAQAVKNHYNVRAVSGVDRSPLLTKLDAADSG